jgi:hypothetical protein
MARNSTRNGGSGIIMLMTDKKTQYKKECRRQQYL